MGLAASAIFAERNVKKFKTQHEGTRGVVAGCQFVSSADSAIKASSSIFKNVSKGLGETIAKADGAVDIIFEKIGGESGKEILNNMTQSTGSASKLGAVAQSAVNPLLCVASGIRVLKDDDQYAKLIEETSAMGAMFGTEAVMKHIRSEITGSAKATMGLSGKVAKTLSKSKTLNNTLSNLKGHFDNIGKTSHGKLKQALIKIGIDTLFVGGSVLAFNLGEKIGKHLSHRDKESNKEV